jgi:hypothetical protein
MAKQKQKQQTVVTWMRGQELPETLTQDEFMAGMGFTGPLLAKLLDLTNVRPLYAQKPGQTKGWPAERLYTRSQMERLIAEYEKNNQPPPPTPEQMIAKTLEHMTQTLVGIGDLLGKLTLEQAGMREQLDEINEKVKQVLIQEAAPAPLTAMQEHANEVPSNMRDISKDVTNTEGARLIRRRHAAQ